MSSKHVGVCKKCGKETEYRFKSRIKETYGVDLSGLRAESQEIRA